MGKKRLKATPENILATLIDEARNRCAEDENTILEVVKEIRRRLNWDDYEFEDNGKKGVKNCAGAIIVPAKYEEIYFQLNEDYHFVCLHDNENAVVTRDGEGTILFQCSKAGISDLLRDILLMKNESGWTCYSFKEKKILVDKCEEVGNCQCGENFLSIKKDGKYGFITGAGVFIPPSYDDVDFGVDGEDDPAEWHPIIVTKKQQLGLVDIKGKFYSLGKKGSEDIEERKETLFAEKIKEEVLSLGWWDL